MMFSDSNTDLSVGVHLYVKLGIQEGKFHW